MAGRYSKLHSNYILKKHHQNINGGGKIFERDWVTIGGQHQIEKGKKPYYSDTNFLFTDNLYPSYKKRHNYGKWVAHWDYDNVKDSKSEINNVVVNTSSNDIRDFAYYGSAVELVRSSIFNIINNFPARVKISPEKITYPNENGGYDELDGDYYLLDNPFDINFTHELTLKEIEDNNVNRFLFNSYSNYTINNNEITSYNVKNHDYDKCEKNILPPSDPIYEVIINERSVIYGYILDGTVVKITQDKNLEIKPKKEIFDDYFSNLDGFEKQLLTLASKPLYKNSFLTPIEGELEYKYVYRNYTWPSSFDNSIGYGHIDISSQSYVSYVQNLIDMATIFDELWCDNLYRNMTHESIKNFDWTYTREYTEGDEQDNIDGGNRMMQLLRIYGRAFDDIKRLSDGIGLVNTNTYDGFNNQPDAEISDRLEMSGWDITSTIPVIKDDDLTNVKIDDDFIEKFITKKGNSSHEKWFDSSNSDYFTAVKSDIEFMRRLILSSSHIFRAKGTQHAIDMVMGLFGFGRDDQNNPDYKLTEKYYYIPSEQFKDYDNNIELVDNINSSKTIEKLYDDVYSGIPLKDMYLGKNHYILPYYTQSRRYDGDLYFESKGGWGKKDNGDYMETLSYLHVVSEFGDLLNINENSLSTGDIYYVVSLTSYNDFKDGKPSSHFFYIDTSIGYNPELPESWIDIIIADENNEFSKRARYLDGLISVNTGNNPHVGYGNYDDGGEYKSYMEQPFKSSIENFYIDDPDLMQEAENFTYKLTDSDDDESGDKSKVKNLISEYDEDANNGKKYYLNRKWFQIENKIDNDFYKEYFKNVILKYVMQVIPSTTILILKNFD